MFPGLTKKRFSGFLASFPGFLCGLSERSERALEWFLSTTKLDKIMVDGAGTMGSGIARKSGKGFYTYRSWRRYK
jgi:hypothetical protein